VKPSESRVPSVLKHSSPWCEGGTRLEPLDCDRGRGSGTARGRDPRLAHLHPARAL